jgi:hypothetical protein
VTLAEVRLFAIAALVIAAVTFIMHGDHYRNRRLQLLQYRVEALEKIVTGEHNA